MAAAAAAGDSCRQTWPGLTAADLVNNITIPRTTKKLDHAIAGPAASLMPGQTSDHDQV